LPVFWLECEAEPEIALPVIMAAHIEPDYTFELSDVDAQALGLTSAADALVLATLTISQQLGTATANLFAPIVVNRHTFLAKQVILEGSKHSLRHPIDSL
ncbi:MAG TPA: flagellar assembly protein FliW, partial [Dehalococcoidia bacterium]|nr:flagellar assembly protein FliW [Dehalococcoidia bacterium]